MKIKQKRKRPFFDLEVFLTTVNGVGGSGRTISPYKKNQTIFSQGDPADAVFYIQEGKAKVTIISDRGKEAVVAIHGKRDFFGEGCLNGQPLRLATVTAMTDCSIMRLEKAAMVRVLHDEPKFSEMFLAYVLSRNARVEEDLVDQLFKFDREASGAGASSNGEFRQGHGTRTRNSQNQSRDAGRNNWHDPPPREHVHEQIPAARLPRI